VADLIADSSVVPQRSLFVRFIEGKLRRIIKANMDHLGLPKLCPGASLVGMAAHCHNIVKILQKKKEKRLTTAA